MNLEECYRLFGIKPNARLYEINQAYRDLAKVWHPERFSNDPSMQAKARAQLKEIDIAYRMLLEFLTQRLANREQEKGKRREQEHEEREHAGQKLREGGQRAKEPEKEIKAHREDRDNIWYRYFKKSKRGMSTHKPKDESPFKVYEYNYATSSFIHRHPYMIRGGAFIVILFGIILIGSVKHITQEDHGLRNTYTPVEAVPSAPEAVPSAPEAVPSAPGAVPSAPEAVPSAPDKLTEKEPAVTLNEAYGAYNKGDYSTAYKQFNALADRGDAEAQFLLGVMYAGGQGVPKNDAEAAKRYRKAADQGYAKSQYNLGLMYAKGEGVPEDYAEAVKWFRKAADQGDVEAQFLLGVMYADGEGVEENDAEAVKWYGKAADQGYAKAQYNLGLMYLNGEGVPQDYDKAVKWFRMAADQGVAQAQYNLGLMYYTGLGLPQDLVQAHKWYSLAAVQGDEDAKKSRDLIARMMTAAQIAESQRLAKGSKPNKPQ
ncbi:MAG: J domain-containing protein [Syntrophobacteraceae bacterium]